MKNRAILLFALLGMNSIGVASAAKSVPLAQDLALRSHPRVSGVSIAGAVSFNESGHVWKLQTFKPNSFNHHIINAVPETARIEAKTEYGTFAMTGPLVRPEPSRLSIVSECISESENCDPPTVDKPRYRTTPPDTSRKTDAVVFAAADLVKSIFDISPAPEINEPMDPELAFQASLMGIRHDALRARPDIHECCYLYRDKIQFELTDHAGNPTTKTRIGEFKLPPGKIKEDEFFGRTDVYYSSVEVSLPIVSDIASGTFGVRITYQGCSEQGVIICYPPQTRNFTVVHMDGAFKVTESVKPN